MSRSLSAARRIISSEISMPWISANSPLSGRMRRPGPQPISSAFRPFGRGWPGGRRRFSSARIARLAGRAETLQFRSHRADHIRGGSQKLGVILFAPPEGDVVVQIFAGPLVPVLAHADRKSTRLNSSHLVI